MGIVTPAAGGLLHLRRLAWRLRRSAATGKCDPAQFPLNRHVRRMKLPFADRRLELFVRGGTTDETLVNMILQDEGEYCLPSVVEPKTIFDVGANIGIATVYFAAVYPQARIYCFEPLAENVELLRMNTRCFGDRIRVLTYGLSDVSGRLTYLMSDDPGNFGGGHFGDEGTAVATSQHRLQLPVKTIHEVVHEHGLDGVDVFKIDTEGSELAILRGMPSGIRTQAQAIIGELHGQSDWEVCSLLAQSHAIGVQKQFNSRCFIFNAIRQDLVDSHTVKNISQAA